jgi:hypothetical protein
MLYPIDENTPDPELRRAQNDYKAQLLATGGDPVEQAILNLRWDGWRIKYAASVDPYPMSPVSAEMMADVQRRIANDCPPAPPASAHARPAPWDNPRDENVCSCQYCRGLKTHKYTKADQYHIIGNGEIEHQ